MSSRSIRDRQSMTSFADSARQEGRRGGGGGGGGGGDDDGDDEGRALTLARPANSSLFVRNVSDRVTTDELRGLFR